MKHYVITMSQTPQSVTAAERCIESGKRFGLEIEKWEATTPNVLLPALLMDAGISDQGFKEVYSSGYVVSNFIHDGHRGMFLSRESGRERR